MADDGTDDSTTERVWLVERTYGDRDLVTLVYATPDGERMHRRERPTTLLRRQPATAAVDLQADELSAVDDADRRERYAREAERLMTQAGPDDEI